MAISFRIARFANDDEFKKFIKPPSKTDMQEEQTTQELFNF